MPALLINEKRVEIDGSVPGTPLSWVLRDRLELA